MAACDMVYAFVGQVEIDAKLGECLIDSGFTVFCSLTWGAGNVGGLCTARAKVAGGVAD
jgi:hypothetical protein